VAGLDCALVMDALATAAATSSLVTAAFGYPTEALLPGQATVGYPESIEFDLTFGRGADKATFPVWVMCGYVVDPATRATVSALIKNAADIKTVIEAHAPAGAYSSVRVTDAAIERVVPLNGSQLVLVRFDCEVIS